VTYNLLNLKDQNYLNIGHNTNPTFPLMNNQSNLFEDTRGFILDTPKDMKLDFFFVLTFGICCVFFQLKLLLPFLELIGIPIPFHFFFHSFLQSFLTCPPVYGFFLLLALSQSLDFCSKPFFYTLILSVSSKYLLFAPSVGCDPSQGFFWKEIFYQAQIGLQGIYIFRKWRDEQRWPFLISSKVS
jgi:hypothetical protein